MEDEAANEQQLTWYLLGNLPEEEQRQVEEQFLSNDQRYDQILALEDELFYDYTQNKLSPGEREQFEKRFLSSEHNRKRAILYSDVANEISETAMVGTADKDIADREQQHFWLSLKSCFAAQGAAMRVSLAALAIASLVLIWLVIGILRLRNELNRLGTQLAVQDDQLRQHDQQERARADELNLKLKREMDENSMLRQELSKKQSQSVGQGEHPHSVISLVLSPSIVRGQAPDMKKLYLPSGARLLKLLLKLKDKEEYKSYQVTLSTVEGAKIWSHEMLRAQRTDSGRSIELWLPTSTLSPGDYQLKLNGYTSDGTLEKTKDYYYLNIRR
jgi:hypothetical protein